MCSCFFDFIYDNIILIMPKPVLLINIKLPCLKYEKGQEPLKR